MSELKHTQYPCIPKKKLEGLQGIRGLDWRSTLAFRPKIGPYSSKRNKETRTHCRVRVSGAAGLIGVSDWEHFGRYKRNRGNSNLGGGMHRWIPAFCDPSTRRQEVSAIALSSGRHNVLHALASNLKTWTTP